MAKTKLIQTNFVYIAGWNGGSKTRQTGSYLGKKAASVDTIKRFLHQNAKDTHTTVQIESVTVTGSHISEYIEK